MIEREIPTGLNDGVCHTPIAAHRRVRELDQKLIGTR
jgi:hypothetical protein